MECGRRKFYHWWKEQELGSQRVDMAVIKEPWCIVIPIFFVDLCAHRKKYEQEVPSYLFFDARLQEYKVILKEVGFLSPMVNLWWLCDFSTNVIVQLLNHVQHFATTWTAARQASLSITISLSLLNLISIESTMPFYQLLLLLTSIFPSIRGFSNESALHIKWPKYWSINFSVSPSNEYSGQISLGLTGLMSSLLRDSQESFPAPQFKSIKFFSIRPLLWSNSHIHTCLLEKP